MKHRYSLVVCCFVFLALVFTRTAIPKYTSHKQLQVTTWDAFGYYMYLPSIFIYHDYKKLNWLKEKDKLYELTGGNGWQAIQETNGNYVFKYLGGVAILEMPFFFVGHFAAKVFNYPQDGFSLPYQYSLAYGILIYCFLALLLLRKILLQYFTDLVTAFTLLNLCLVTNFIQYAAVDNALSHAYIFLLYCALLFSTVKWHEQPKIIWAALIGWLIGEAVICRPTEAIMLLIPMFWNTQNKMASLEKWHLVLKNKAHVFIAFVFGILGILPQLIYWKLTTGSFVYDVGSKWQFFNPWFRVLFGFEKGWFVYTPITLFFILGLFFLKKFPFKKSVLWFCLLNIWIVISWSDWHYGGSYSTRALVQCYPVFALPFAACVEMVNKSKWKIGFYLIVGLLFFVNCFQIWQYNKGILLYDGMNKTYYRHIFLNPKPSALEFSLIDHQEFISCEQDYFKQILSNNFQSTSFQSSQPFIEQAFILEPKKEYWLKVETRMVAPNHLWNNFLKATVTNGKNTKEVNFRLFRPMIKEEQANEYAFYLKLPKHFVDKTILTLFVNSKDDFRGNIRSCKIQLLKIKE